MVYTKKQLERHGINRNFLREMLGKPVHSYEVTPLQKGYMLHSDLYKFALHFNREESLDLFVKDTNDDQNVAGTLVKSVEVNNVEAEIYELGAKYGARVPLLHGKFSFKEGDVTHNFLFMRKYKQSLEDMLGKMRRDYLKAAPKSQERKDITDLLVSYLVRIVDISLINSEIINARLDPKDSNGTLRVRTHDAEQLYSQLKEYLLGLVALDVIKRTAGRIEKNGKGFKQFIDNSAVSEVIQVIRDVDALSETFYPQVADSLMRFVAEPLASNPDDKEMQRIIQPDLIPGHVLLDDSVELEDYNPNFILDALEGDCSPYEGFVITDFQNVGYYPIPLKFASLLNHPSMIVMLPYDRAKQVVEHALVQQHRIKTKNRNIQLYNISNADRIKYEELFNPSSVCALLKNIGFITWLKLRHKEKADELISRNPLYNVEEFVGLNILRAEELKKNPNDNPNDRFSSLIDMLNSLKLI